MCSMTLPVRNPTQAFMPVPYLLSSCHYRQFAIICTAFTVIRYKHQLYRPPIFYSPMHHIISHYLTYFYVAHECQRIMSSHHNDCCQFFVYIISTSNLNLVSACTSCDCHPFNGISIFQTTAYQNVIHIF